MDWSQLQKIFTQKKIDIRSVSNNKRSTRNDEQTGSARYLSTLSQSPRKIGGRISIVPDWRLKLDTRIHVNLDNASM